MSFLRGSSHYVWSTSCVLGKGAMGTVFQGVHQRTGESVAVKTFNHMSHMRPTEVQMREFEVMKKLDHENIVKMLAIEEEIESQKKVLVMELCNGGSLFTILDDPQNIHGLEEEEFLCVLKDISAGMKYLRDNNIIHRDLKPGNIMKYISEDGGSVYKLTDFGAARELGDDQQFMSLYGTEEYLHPDMYERAVLHHPAKKPFRATVDLWSIGVTLYHVATGSLPFRPFGGRKNRQTMHYITTKKASGVISGVQHSEKGPIEWSKELPNTCLLSNGLRDLVTNLLSGILECDDEQMWTFEQFFACVTDIITRKVFHVFYLNEGKEISLYLQPDRRLEDLKEQITSQLIVPSSCQLLLYDKSLFVTQIDSSSSVDTFSSTTYEQPLILVHSESTGVTAFLDDLDLSACFPIFHTSSVNTDHDAALAKTCCSVAHAVKRRVVRLVRCRKLLLKAPQILLSLTHENVLQLCTNLDVLKQRVDDINNICDLYDKSNFIFTQFLSLCNQQDECDGKLQNLSVLIEKKNEFKKHVRQKFLSLQSSIQLLKQKILISKSLQNEWKQALTECKHLTGCVEVNVTYVNKIRDSWQSLVRDKTLRVLSSPDQQFHILEKVKIQETSKKLTALLQEQCLTSCLDASHKLDEWYSGMQAAMVQCRCLEEDLSSINTLVKSYMTMLKEVEGETFEIQKNIISSLKISTHKYDTSEVCSKTPYNGEVSDERKLKSRIYKNVLSQLDNLKEKHSSLWEITQQNNALLEKFSTMMENMPSKEQSKDIYSE